MHPQAYTLTYVLQFRRFGEVIPGYDEEGGKIDPSVLVRLHLKALTIPVDGVVQAVLVGVLRLYELVLQRERERVT